MRCPECKEVLLNPNHCRDCGWKRDGQTEDRSCYCGQLGSVQQNGQWWCPNHHAEQIEGPKLASEIVSGYLEKMRAKLREA